MTLALLLSLLASAPPLEAQRAFESATGADRPAAELALARSLDAMGLPFSAFFHYAAVAEAGRGTAFLDAVSGAAGAAEALGDEIIAPSVFEKIYGNDLAALPPERLARIHSWLALLAYRAGHLDEAARFAAKVPQEAKAYPQALYIGALVEQRSDPARAADSFRALAGLQTADSGLRELASLALGRTLYGLHRYAEAGAAYGSLPRFSRHWDEALFEGAYADLRNGDPGGALGKLHSLRSPHLRDEFAPESLNLTAILFQQRCLYPQVRQALEELDREYLPMRDQAKAVLQAGPAVEEYWRMLSPEDERLPTAMKQHLLKNERVASLAAYLGRLAGEEARIRSEGSLSGTALREELLENLARQEELARRLGGKFVQGRLADMAHLIEVLASDRELIAFEATKGEKEMLESRFDPGPQLASQRLSRPVPPKSGSEYWPFDGEYWPDEIGYYRYTVKDACPAAAAKPAAADDAAREAATEAKRDELIGDLATLLPRLTETDRRADLEFQLAELWWEKARAASLREVREHDQAYAKWAEGGRKGEEPKADTSASADFRSRSLAIYQRILASHPRYQRRDEVLFVSAQDLDESGDREGAMARYRELVEENPRSRLVPDALVQMGEHYFAANDLDRARESFRKAAASRLPKIHPFALYKLAWCDYNAGAYAAAVAKFQEVIAYAEGETRGDRVQLESEALRDIVLAYARLNAVEDAVQYLAEKAGARAIESIERLASTYFESGKFERSVRIYRMLEERAPSDPRAPAWQQRIVLCFDKLDRRDQVAAEMTLLASRYRSKAGGPEEEALRQVVQDYHQEAIKTKSAATYRLASEMYRQYLLAFPGSPAAVSMRFYLAEILYSLEEWDAAAAEYGKVLEEDPRGQYAQRAAFDSVLALERSVDLSRGKLADEGHGEEDALPDNERNFVAACDRYAQVAPEGTDAIAIRYKAAFLLYQRGHFAEAARRFDEIIFRWPGNAWSQKAANLSLDILDTRQEWQELHELGERYLANRDLCPEGSKFAGEVARIAEGAKFKQVMRIYEQEKDLPRAAREFRAFVARYPKSEHAPKALYDALVIADKAGELDVEIAAGEQLLRDHPGAEAEILGLTLPALGSACERAGRFADAIRWYEQAQQRWPEDARAADWLYEASLLRENLGDDAGALQGWRKYLGLYRSRPDAARIAFDIGLILERQKDFRGAARHWSAFQREWSRAATAGQLFFARYRQALALRALDAPEAAAILADVPRRFASLPGSERGSAAAIDAKAHAGFLAEAPGFDEFQAVRFRSGRQADLVAALKLKKARLNRLLAAYGEVVAIGSPLWSEAAFTRIGEAYRDFNKGLLDAPLPRGLDAEQEELYRSTLSAQALPLEDKAVEAFRKAVEVSEKSGVYSEWTLRAQDFLREYQPESLGPRREPGWAEGSLWRPVAPALAVKEAR